MMSSLSEPSIISCDFVTINMTKLSDMTDVCDSMTDHYSNPNPKFYKYKNKSKRK